MEILDTLKNGYKIFQDSERFKFGIDAVLLSHFAFDKIKNGNTVIDLGTGNGIIPLMLSKSRAASITGLEIQKGNVVLAEKSVSINQLEEKIKIVEGDIKTVSNNFAKHSFDVVTTNPPYMIHLQKKHNFSEAKLIARNEILCNLEDVISATDYLLKPCGKFFMIHKPARLPEIFNALLKHSIEPKTIQLISPFQDKEPNLVLIEARKNAKPDLKFLKNLIVYNKPGEYTQDIKDIYSTFAQ